MTSVNVDGKIAKEERNALLKLASSLEDKNNRCLICSGHGAVSTLSEDGLEVYGKPDHYTSKEL